MKVLILNPPAYKGIKFIREGRCEQRLSSFQYVMVPISLPSIAGLLREKGHELRIVDSMVEDYGIAEVKEEIRRFDPSLIIVDMSTVTYFGDAATIEALKEGEDYHIAAIGTHVTALPEATLKETKLDSVIRGEPEETSLCLADALENANKLSEVEGISFRQNGQILHNPSRPFIENLDQLPFPARDLIKNDRYTMPVSNRPYTLVITSRGCSHNCIFCTARQYYGCRLRKRTPKNIVDEIEEIIKRFGITDITMWSDTFTLDREFVVGVCNEIKRRGLGFNWMTNSRVDRVDKGLLKLMKEAGCSMLSFGIESGSQRILNNVRKGTTLEQAEQVFIWTKELGIETIAHFILGLPGETKETIAETIRFARKLDPDYPQFYGAIPFPGTEFYELAANNGWITTNDWSKYELNQAIVSTPSLSVEQLGRARKKAFRSFYLRPRYIGKTLAKLKSFGELLNIIKQGLSFAEEWVFSK